MLNLYISRCWKVYCSLIQQTSTTENVNKAKMKFLCRENKLMENIPSTSNALLQIQVFGLQVTMFCRTGLHQSLGDGNGKKMGGVLFFGHTFDLDGI